MSTRNHQTHTVVMIRLKDVNEKKFIQHIQQMCKSHVMMVECNDIW